MELLWFNSVEIHLKDANGITNRVDHDQTLLYEQSDLGLHCFLRSVCPNV